MNAATRGNRALHAGTRQYPQARGESAGWPRPTTPPCAGSRVEEGRDSTGQEAGSQPGAVRRRKVQQRADRRWAGPRARPQARVKRCGKSAPSSGATSTDRQTPPGARPSRDRAARPMIPGRPLRWMATPPTSVDGQNPAYRPTHRTANTEFRYGISKLMCPGARVPHACADIQSPRPGRRSRTPRRCDTSLNALSITRSPRTAILVI